MPEEVLNTRSIYTQENDIRKLKKKKTWKKKVTAKMGLAKHGNTTNSQKYSYLTLGTVFWLTVMIIGTSRIIYISNFESKLRLLGEIARCNDISDVELSSKLQEMR